MRANSRCILLKGTERVPINLTKKNKIKNTTYQFDCELKVVPCTTLRSPHYYLSFFGTLTFI